MVNPTNKIQHDINQRAQIWILNSLEICPSSKAIWGVMTGQRLDSGSQRPRYPSDFGRCYRLLQLIPEWQVRLIEVSQSYPNWMPLIRDWLILADMYEVALQNRRPVGPAFYTTMRELLTEGDEHAKMVGGGRRVKW